MLHYSSNRVIHGKKSYKLYSLSVDRLTAGVIITVQKKVANVKAIFKNVNEVSFSQLFKGCSQI